MQDISDQSAVWVISGNRLAASFLRSRLASVFTAVEIGMPEGIPILNHLTALLFILDASHLGFPLTEFVKRVTAKYPGAYMIAIDDDERLHQIPFLLSLGVQGFVSLDQVDVSLVPAVQHVITGGVWVPHGALMSQTRKLSRRNGSPAVALTHREMEVLDLVQRRLSNKEIADTLRIRESTVKYHVGNLFCKLAVNRRQDLANQERGYPIAGLL